MTTVAPRPAQAQGPDGLGLFIGLAIGVPTAIAFTFNVLAAVGETTRDDQGYMKAGWVTTQYIAGAMDVGAGIFTLAVAMDSNNDGLAAVAAIPFALSALWFGLATYHVVHNRKVGRAPPRRPGYGPYAAPTSVPVMKFDQLQAESSAVLVDQLRRELGGPQGPRSPKGRPQAAGPPGRSRAGVKRSELCDRHTRDGGFVAGLSVRW